MSRMNRDVTSLEALTGAAEALVAELTPKASGATLITLSGELGAGKTAFAGQVAAALGVTEDVPSPTFVLEKIYALTGESSRGFARLLHIDAYRFEHPDELAALGFDEAMADRENLILLEWPERIDAARFTPTHALRLEVVPNGTRTLSYA